MKNNTPYKIVYSDSNYIIEAQGPLLKDHLEEEIKREDAFGLGNTWLEKTQRNKYLVRNLKVFDSKNKLIEEFENYLLYELKESGPCLSVQQETLHGNYPLISRAAYYIAMFDEYNQELTSWMPENKLSWDIEKRILTIL